MGPHAASRPVTRVLAGVVAPSVHPSQYLGGSTVPITLSELRCGVAFAHVLHF